MGVETSRFEALHRLARRYVEDGLRFADALDEAERVERAFGREAFMASAIYQLEKAVAALRAENRALRAEVTELERRLDPCAAEAEASERELESRLARELRARGLRDLDALHLAAAEQGGADILITTDDRFIRAAQALQPPSTVRVENPVIFELEVFR